LLEELADGDLLQVGAADRIDIECFSRLSDARQRNVLRRALQRLRLPAAPATRLRQVIDELVPCRDDAMPLVSWPGAEVRRFRGKMYILPPLPASLPAPVSLDPASPEQQLAGLGTLRLVAAAETGIDPRRLTNGVQIRFRRGGEAIRPLGHHVTHKLKKLLQQAGVVPWMRDRIPLLYAGEELLAVGDLWLSDECASSPGFGVSWEAHPAIY
jgi:tRNA(Ile)-lysidine synthase